MTAIKFDVMVIVFVGWTSILVDGVFIGRGIIKRKIGGGIDEGSFALLRRPRIVFAITCGSIITCIFFFSIADLIINGSFLNAPPPSASVTSVINPRNLLPAKCYGECRSNLNIGFFSLWLLTMIAIGLEHFPTIKCCDCVIIDNRKQLDLLELGVQKAEDLLDTSQKAYLMNHVKSMKVRSKISDGSGVDGDKFLGTNELICGALENLTEGLQSFLNVSDQKMSNIRQNPEQAIINEVNELGEPEVIELLKYIREEPVSEKQYANGVRDQGRRPGMQLEDFMDHENVKSASLKREHVIALRLYTTLAYKFINNPLRDMKRKNEGKQHPLSACVLFIEEGIKKLRNVTSKSDSASKDAGIDQSAKILWRGMKKVHASKEFLLKGGAELAPMSTTSEFAVAVQYGTCVEGSLLLKIVVELALNHGADLQWLSAFPGEAEVLYPPLTYLQSTKCHQVLTCEENGITVDILELVPNMSASA